MKYKFNRYLLANDDENQNMIIYDTLSYNSYLIEKEKRDIYCDLRTQILQNGEYNGPKENLKLLMENNIIQPWDADMDEKLQQRFHEVFDDHRVLRLIILPTEQCNFRCVYCYEEFKYGKMSDVTIDRISQLIERMLPEYQVLELAWFGGEPLLAMDVIRKISDVAQQICKKYKKSYYMHMTTNGYYLNVDTVKELLRYHTMMYQITIDGDRVSHNKQRHLADGSGTYDVVLNNLLAIKEQIKTKLLRVVVRVNVSAEMRAEEINELINIFSDDERFFFDVHEIFGAASGKAIEETNLQSYFQVLKECQGTVTEDLRASKLICYAAKNNTLMIRADGTLGRCTVNFNDVNNNFGNIQSIDMKTFSVSSLKYCNSIIEELCKECSIYPLCFGRQCAAREVQVCEKMIAKCAISVKSYASVAKVLKLI